MVYRLKAVITHEGASIRVGHYVAYFSVNGEWYEANDSVVKETDWETVRKLQVYVLFYQRF